MTKNKIKNRLRAARKLIEKPEHWTKGAFQRDISGYPVTTERAEVVSRCAYGAIIDACLAANSAYSDDERIIRSLLMDSVKRHLPIDDPSYLGIARWNDEPSRTHAEVVLAFDRAIADVS